LVITEKFLAPFRWVTISKGSLMADQRPSSNPGAASSERLAEATVDAEAHREIFECRKTEDTFERLEVLISADLWMEEWERRRQLRSEKALGRNGLN
jgi:hypothetical protein